MPIHVPPNLEAAALAHIQGVTNQNAQFTAAIANKQGTIDGTVGPAPGLQAAENVNADLYNQYSIRLGYFESERKALEGIFPSPILTDGAPGTDIWLAAGRTGILFAGNVTLVPTQISSLYGGGGSGADNEIVRLAAEAAAIATLQGLAIGLRLTDPAYTAWVAAMNAQVPLLQAESTAIHLNESYGMGSVPYAQAQAELFNVLSLVIPPPPVDNVTLALRAAQVSARQAQVTARLTTLTLDRQAFYDQRFMILQARVNLIVGTLAQLLGAQSSIATISSVSALNSQLLTLYNTLV